MHGAGVGIEDRLAVSGRLAQLSGRRFRPVGVIGNGRPGQLRGWANGVWRIDREPAGGGRLAQLRGCTEWARGVKGKLAGGGRPAQLRVGQRLCHST